jgi:hypothetical protein
MKKQRIDITTMPMQIRDTMALIATFVSVILSLKTATAIATSADTKMRIRGDL